MSCSPPRSQMSHLSCPLQGYSHHLSHLSPRCGNLLVQVTSRGSRIRGPKATLNPHEVEQLSRLGKGRVDLAGTLTTEDGPWRRDYSPPAPDSQSCLPQKACLPLRPERSWWLPHSPDRHHQRAGSLKQAPVLTASMGALRVLDQNPLGRHVGS